ncbi:pectinesterase A [Thermoclostridium stercorarium subsp. stercorarium DSM 8532]|jgi:pectinesterase|uniref:Pectinesterase n=3 Tax=Thermoclostridium stercorarium TaxID=1510 RepID=L7VN00_THES1|nr:pectinesterase family protein [Thermoclostridium stercorarium]AGC69600.1 pectinesterase A [Thermoclostridium stercorarium subsp. stercorarium DSM 8532]AGI40551.1 pectin methylesterase [Thermoclostridium stercorarium subsp. stercorarium DSM 8532]ANW99829.1 pectin methylesterase [Thermoclostridium stercorarium subsp. thermolacticum DSM 2910]ANX02456.1 pectin methylesterase [Thermoclostridium stercorarium subsp. leptospartum DSM 9219]UZQ85539.1 pectinesterase family protein [Thermoclostridium 
MIVAADGSGDYLSLGQALQALENMKDSGERVVIHIKKGIYREKLHISRPNVTLIGEDAESTVITYDDYARKRFENGEEYGTFNSYTVLITGDGFEARNLTIENAAGSGTIKGQALAAYVDADRAVFRNCRFLGHQDTLFTAPLPPAPIIKNGFKGPGEHRERKMQSHYYENCYIEGDVDFIFGSATAVFKNCTIVSLDRGEPEGGVNGYITAASTPEGVKYGYVFINCRLLGKCKPSTVYLGRPWRNFARTVFINCYMDDHIKSEGWHNWDKPESESTVFYAEYNSYGPGARPDKRVQWAKILTDEEAKEYTIEKILPWLSGRQE